MTILCHLRSGPELVLSSDQIGIKTNIIRKKYHSLIIKNMSKNIIITGSAKLQTDVQKWRKFWEKHGTILDYPKFLDQNNYLLEYSRAHPYFHQQLEKADVQFVMNEDKNGIVGYIGAASFAEMNYAIIRKIVHHQNIEIILLKMPDPSIFCIDEIGFWLKLGWIGLFQNSSYSDQKIGESNISS